MRVRLLLALGLFSVTACAVGDPTIPSPRRDAGVDAARDVGTDAPDAFAVDAALDDAFTPDAAMDDAGTDAGAPDAGVDAGRDAGTDAGRDAGPIAAPTIDGVVGAAEWAPAVAATSTTATIWTGNQLTAIRGIALAGTLYLAIEGRVDGGNAMLVYVDGDPGGAHGVTTLASLTDSIGALDDAISAGFTTPAGFHADVAWGTLDLSRTLAGADDRLGFRDLAVSTSDLAWLTGGSATTACTAAACEMRIPTASLGPSAGPRTIQLFARIVNHDGTMSPNQTLPMDDPSTPRVVTMLLEVDE
jgi:hypothetical protein